MNFGVNTHDNGQKINAYASRDQAQNILGFKGVMNPKQQELATEVFTKDNIVMPKMDIRNQTELPMWNWDKHYSQPQKKEVSIYNPLRGKIYH
mmetsp:Transcript_28660/g.43280  ORF Transcript_28660/g.43280 Transcript_28660/m.43280 type:complete len:93 (-) Transcript_28660:130-408(-)|eukprot:CAMPEP_0170484316 /NCGR_PEP_ID=MMETSP0208-20121228/3812_1 /TAXON_ID=197538 /ORGANISM="Strombidium inclinatum, Strain S3" /LENGTH=92 /DNA_ID=CAMNT_0010757621 /DNA_START=38 /DNA_END=316 /DNA_ORIENTATION=+